MTLAQIREKINQLEKNGFDIFSHDSKLLDIDDRDYYVSDIVYDEKADKYLVKFEEEL